jgi:hypothetical protein
MKITVREDKNYGIRTIYPHCEAAQIFARIAGTKTLTAHALRDIAALGYTIEVFSPPPRILAEMEAIR